MKSPPYRWAFQFQKRTIIDKMKVYCYNISMALVYRSYTIYYPTGGVGHDLGQGR